jgi:hypothetical protein
VTRELGPRTSATSSSPGSYDDVIGETNARSPR